MTYEEAQAACDILDNDGCEPIIVKKGPGKYIVQTDDGDTFVEFGDVIDAFEGWEFAGDEEVFDGDSGL